jgi:exodeoxyribonuclease-5
MASNKVIRTGLLGKQNPDIIEVGDVLMAYRSVSSANQQYNIIENSADYRVMEKSDREINEFDIWGYMVKLRENVSHDKFRFVDVFIVDTNDHDNLHQYAEVHDYFKEMAIPNKKLWNKYYDFRRQNIIMKTIDTYRNGMARENSEIIKKDLDYGYAITGHKSQGSTYQHVMVMLNDIEKNWILKERNQISYVALTRPSISATVLCSRIDT